MPAPDTCTVTGVLLDIDEQPWAGVTVTARPYDGAFFRQRATDWQQLEDGERSDITADDGSWSFDLPWGSESDPSSVQWIITTPTSSWIGVVPSISGPITIKGLKDSYNWGIAAENLRFPVRSIQGADVPNWATPPDWRNDVHYFPGDAVFYQNGSWRSLTANFNSPPSQINPDWYPIALGAGSFGQFDASVYGSDIAAAIAAVATLLAGNVGTLNVSSPMSCGSNITVPRNMSLAPVSGGLISVNSGVTLRILGPILDPGARQIFAASGTNTGAAGTGSISFAYPNWDSTKTYATGDRAINYGSLPAGVLWQATGSSLAATPRTNTVTGLTSGGTSILTGAQTVNYMGTSLATNAPITVEPGTVNEETITISGAPTYSQKTGTGTFTATFTRTHTAPIEVTNPSWTRVVSVPVISSTSVVRPEWWGAKADSDVGQVNTDCSPSFNAMIGALPGRGGVEIRCTGGIYAFASTIKIDSFSNPNQKQDFTITGNYSPLASGSVGGTTFMWAGPSTWPTLASILAGTPITLTPLFECYSREVLTKGVFFTVANGYTCDVLVDIDWATPTTSGGATNHADRFENCAFGFPLGYTVGVSGQPRLGVRIGAKNLPNGEYMNFVNCEFMHTVATTTMSGWWQQQWAYNTGDIAWWAGEPYISLIDANVNHKPDVGLNTVLTPTQSAYWAVADPSIIGGCGLYTPNTTAQVTRTLLENCHFAGVSNNAAVYATQQWGIFQVSGSFNALECEFFHMPQAIRVLSTWDTILIDGLDSEGCQQLYRADGTVTAQPTRIANGRLALAQVDTSMPVGGEYIHCNAGPTLLEGLDLTPGETTGTNPAFSIYTPSTSALAIRSCRMPSWAFLVTDSVDAPIAVDVCKVKQGTGSLDRVLPRYMIHGAKASANSATGSGVGSGSYSAPFSIGLLPSNVTPKILRPLAPIVHPINAQIFKGSNRAGALATGSYQYLWTRWNAGVEYPMGTLLTQSPVYTDVNGNAVTGEIWVSPPPIAKPTDSKYTLYRSDDGGASFHFLSDVTIGSQAYIDITPSVAGNTTMPSFPAALEPGIYDWAITQANAAGLETDASDRFTVQFNAAAAPVLAILLPTAGTDHINCYRSKVFAGATAPTVALAVGSGIEVGTKHVYAVATIYGPISITDAVMTIGSNTVHYTGSQPAAGKPLVIDYMGGQYETVTVTASDATTITAVFGKTHALVSGSFPGAAAFSHISPISATITTTTGNCQVTVDSIPTSATGTYRLLLRTKNGGAAFTSSFFPVVLITDATSTGPFTDRISDANLPGTSAFNPTLLKLPLTAYPKDYGNYLFVSLDDTTQDAGLLTSLAQPNLPGTNQAVIESFTVTDGGARINGDLTIGGGQFSGQGALRMTGPPSGTPAVSAASTFALSYDKINNKVLVSVNAGPWTDMLAVTQGDIVYQGLLKSTGTGNVALVPLGGGGATATATVSGGAITAVNVTASGDGYNATPTVFFQPQGGDTPSVTATGTCTMSDNGVASITVTNGGAGYTTPPLVTIFPSVTNGAGSGATYSLASDANNQRGRFTLTPLNGVASVTVTAGGTGYVQGAAVTFTRHAGDLTGTGAAGYINVSAGVITSITVTNPGTAYTAAPDISVPTGTGATLTAVLSATSTAAVARLVLAGHAKVPGFAAPSFYGTPSGGTSNVDLAFKNVLLSSNSDKVQMDLVANIALTAGVTYNIGYFALP